MQKKRVFVALVFSEVYMFNDQELQEIAKKKKSLKRYRKNIACINRLELKLKTLDERITAIKSPNFSGMPRGGIPITLDDLISDKLDLEDRIKRLKKKSIIIKREILTEIDKLDDPRYCEILESFFIDCIPLEDIADNEGYTERHIYRLYSEAVTMLALKGQ